MASGNSREKLGRTGRSARHRMVVRTESLRIPNWHDTGSTTPRSVGEVALIWDTISHYSPVLIAGNQFHRAGASYLWLSMAGFRRREAKLFPSRGVKLPCLLRFNVSGIRSKQERKMATQNPKRLRTNCPGGSLTLGGDTTVNRLGFGAMRLCGLVYGVNRLIVRVLSAC